MPAGEIKSLSYAHATGLLISRPDERFLSLALWRGRPRPAPVSLHLMGPLSPSLVAGEREGKVDWNRLL